MKNKVTLITESGCFEISPQIKTLLWFCNQLYRMLTNIIERFLKWTRTKDMITVYYDGACPACVKDRDRYEKLAGSAGNNVFWFDITGQKQRMHEVGIDHQKALMELHV